MESTNGRGLRKKLKLNRESNMSRNRNIRDQTKTTILSLTEELDIIKIHHRMLLLPSIFKSERMKTWRLNLLRTN